MSNFVNRHPAARPNLEPTAGGRGVGRGRVRLALAAYAALLVLALVPAARAQSFSLPFSRDVGPNPNAAAAADFDGDGVTDLAVALTQGAAVNVLLGKGDGTFASSTAYNTDSNPEGVAAGDFNKDGKLDVVVGNFFGGPLNAGSVSVLLGKGDGTFHPAVNYDAGSPHRLTAADLNADGRLDLVTASWLTDKVTVLLGKGDGTFNAATGYAVGREPRGASVADFDEDGKPDLAVVSFFGADVSLLRGNGDGTFQPAVSYALPQGSNGIGIDAGDINDDGNEDVVVSAPGAGVAVLLGKGDATFHAAVGYGAGSVASGPQIADFNGDAKPDVAVVTDYFAAKLSVLRGNGDGTLQAPLRFPTQNNPFGLVAADFNSDGKPDLATTNNGIGRINVLLNSPSLMGANVNMTATVATSDILVGTFTDFDATKTAASFTAAVEWGDGTAPSAGTVSAHDRGGFLVTGSHLYAAAGSYTLTVRIADDAGNFASATGTATVDNNVPPSVQFDAASHAAAEGGASVVLTVTRTLNAGPAVSVNYATANGTATAGSDYTAASGTLNFAAGEVSKTITMSILDDAAVEGAETFHVTLSSPTGGALLGPASTTTVTISDNDTCSYQLSATSRNSPAAGESVTVNVTAPVGCAWTAASNSGFVAVTDGATGSGNGSVTFSVAANNSTAPRAGTLTVAGQTFNVAQAGVVCSYSVSPEGLPEFTAEGGAGSFQMIAPQGCAWNASSLAPWITITSGASGTGNGTVAFTVAPNPGPARSGQVLRTDDSFFVVAQAAGGSAFGYGEPANFQPGEGANRAQITVVRTGDLSRPASVTFQTVDDPEAVPCATVNGKSYARCDYATTVETLTWAAGDSQPKTVSIPLIDDSRVEGAETFQVRLSDPQGGILFGSGVATLAVQDNDATEGANPINGSPFFVRMQYLDFLSREPEAGEPWTGVLARCPDVNNRDGNSPSAGCDRIKVSQSFFESPELQLKALYSYLFYRVAFGRRPDYAEIIPDMRGLAGATPEEVFQRRAAYAVAIARRPEFTGLYSQMTNQQYVDALLGRHSLAQITTENPQDFEGTSQVTLTRQQLLDALNSNTLTRAQVLRAVVQSNQVDAAEYHGAFVSMQYYGYLRRTPEQSGYDAWLRVIKQDPNNVRQMVDGFLNSQEYRLRFGQP